MVLHNALIVVRTASIVKHRGGCVAAADDPAETPAGSSGW